MPPLPHMIERVRQQFFATLLISIFALPNLDKAMRKLLSQARCAIRSKKTLGRYSQRISNPNNYIQGNVLFSALD